MSNPTIKTVPELNLLTIIAEYKCSHLSMFIGLSTQSCVCLIIMSQTEPLNNTTFIKQLFLPLYKCSSNIIIFW